MLSRTAGGLRFAPGDFKYNGRIATALLPSLLVLAGFGGRIPCSVGMVGAMVAYILDAARFRQGALASIWLTMGIVNLSLWLTQDVFTAERPVFVFLIGNGVLLFTTGVWATLQFKWIQLQYPVVVLAFEKLLFATAFTTAAMTQSWGLIAAVGAAHAPFYILLILCILYHLLALPLNTSFHVKPSRESAIGGRVEDELRIQAPFESGVAAFLLTCLPGALYSAMHISVLFESKHFWSVLLLFSAPALYLSILKEGLWWLPCSQPTRMGLRQILLLASLAVSLAALEGRLIFPAFGQYIILHPPWNYLLVTTALYGFAAIGFILFSGVLTGIEHSTLAGSVILISALLGSFAAGLPISVIPAPMLAAGGLALFLQSRDFRDYIFFALGAALTMGYLIYHHFWFLDVDLQGMSLQRFCALLWFTMLPALLFPGLYISDAPQAVCNALLLIQAALLSFLEERLFMGTDDIEAEMYPAGMVLLTSVLGLLAVRRLKTQDKMRNEVVWILSSALAAKLSMLILPQERLMLPLFLVTLAVSAPVLLELGVRGAGKQFSVIQPWQPVLCMLGVVLSVLNARNSIYALLHHFLGQKPSEGLLAAVIVLAWGAGLLPLVLTVYKARRDVKRLLSLLLAFGILLAILRPPLPYKGGADCPGWLPSALCLPFWDASHRPDDDDDISIWGEDGAKPLQWPLWMLIGAGVSMLSSVTQETSRHRKSLSSIGPLAISGLSIGLYLALEFFPDQLTLQVLVTLGIGLMAAFLFGLRLRKVASPQLLALLLSAWSLTIPMAFAVQWLLPLSPLPQEAQRLFPDSKFLVEEQRKQSNRAALLAVYSAETMLIAFAAKLRISAVQAPVEDDILERNSSAAQMLRMGNMYANSAAKFLGQCLPTDRIQAQYSTRKNTGRTSMSAQLIEGEGLWWLPGAANIITVSCFVMSLILARALEQDSDLAIFALAPILLLLNQETLLWWLEGRRRYLPATLGISAYLAFSSFAQVLPLLHQPRYLMIGHTGYTATFVKNLWLSGFSLLGHYSFNQYLWDRTEVTGAAALCIGGVQVAAAIFANLTVIKLLAGSGCIMVLVQYLLMVQTSIEGARLI